MLKSLDTACITDHSGEKKWCLWGIFQSELGARQLPLSARSLSRIPPPLLCMQMRSHGATELISLHLQLGSSQTWGDQNTSNILGDNVPPVSGSPTSLALPQRGCLLAGETRRGKREEGGQSVKPIFVTIQALTAQCPGPVLSSRTHRDDESVLYLHGPAQ